MKEPPAAWLAKAIAKLPADPEVPKGTQGYAHYTTQKDHWLGWLDPDRKPVTYVRADPFGRGAKTTYNAIGEPKMLLYLIEATGMPEAVFKKARLAARDKKALSSQCAAIRRVVPWAAMEAALTPFAEESASS